MSRSPVFRGGHPMTIRRLAMLLSVVLTFGVAACGGDDDNDSGGGGGAAATQESGTPAAGGGEEGGNVKLAFSAPGADHGWMAAITENARDRKSTRLNSSHVAISYAVFCLKKKKKPLLTRVSSIPTVKSNSIIFIYQNM